MICQPHQGRDHWYYAIVFLRSQRYIERVINLIGGEWSPVYLRVIQFAVFGMRYMIDAA